MKDTKTSISNDNFPSSALFFQVLLMKGEQLSSAGRAPKLNILFVTQLT